MSGDAIQALKDLQKDFGTATVGIGNHQSMRPLSDVEKAIVRVCADELAPIVAAVEREMEELRKRPVPDLSPGDVISAEKDGTIVLDDGITTWNPTRACEFLLAASEAVALREAHEALEGVRSTVEFYLRREIESPSNHQEFAREASEKLARFQTVCNTLAPTSAQAAALEKVIQSARLAEAEWWFDAWDGEQIHGCSERLAELRKPLDPEVP